MPAVFALLTSIILTAKEAASQTMDTSLALTDIKFVRLNIDVDPGKRYLKGRAELDFTVPDRSKTLPTEVELADEFIIKSIKSDSTSLYYYRTNGHVRIYPVPEWRGMDSITIEYYGVPPSSGLGSVVFDSHDNTPVFWTLSEPFGAMDWWPCKQDIRDKIDSISITISCPARYRAVANGVAVSERVKGDTRITEWQHHYPIAYHLICVAVSNYRKYSDWLRNSRGDSLEMVNYVYPEKYDQWRRRTYKLQPAYRMMCEYFGNYPFADERYGQAQFGWGGGMEHQTMSFISNAGLNLMIHELAHQWFGNMITSKRWEDIFLHEGLATYCEMLAIEKGVGASSDAPQWRLSCINRAIEKPHESLCRSQARNTDELFDYDVTYCKGAMMLHMLRQNLGDQNFFYCLKSYISNPLYRYGNASIEDFINTVNTITGSNMDWFFNQWYYGKGHPRYDILWHQSVDDIVEIAIRQESTDPSVELFRGKVPMMLHGTNGEKILYTPFSRNKYDYGVVAPKFTVKEIELDPYHEIIAEGEVEPYRHDAGRIQIKKSQSIIKVELPDTSSFTHYWLRSSKIAQTHYFGNQRKIEIQTSELPNGQYILSFNGRDYYCTTINIWNKRKKKKDAANP